MPRLSSCNEVFFMRVLLKFLGEFSLIETDDIERDKELTRIAVRESDNDLICDSISIDEYTDCLIDGLVHGYIDLSEYEFLLSYN